MNLWPDRHTSRQIWTPDRIRYNNHDYQFESYGSKKHRRVFYRCIYGNRSIPNHCTAIAFIEFDAEKKRFNFVLKQKHTCSKVFETDTPFYSDVEIMNKVCEFYFDKRFNHMPDAIFNALLEWINESTPKESIKNVVSQHKIRNYVHNLNLITQENIVSFEKTLTLSDERFLLFQLTCDKKQIIGFSSDFMLSCVKECTVIGIDSTFYSSPNNYYQLCVFIGRSSVINLPLLYLLLPNKSEATYCYAFECFKRSLIESGGCFMENVKFVSDFEFAEINAIKKIFLINSNSLQLCYFHYCQAIEKKFRKIFGFLADSFEKNLLKIIKLLPFIPKKNCIDFIQFLPSISSISEKIQNFINYFYKTFFIKYSVDYWNTEGKPLQAKATNNPNESFNKKISNKISKNPNMSQFISAIQSIENEMKNKYNNLRADTSVMIFFIQFWGT